MSIDIFSVLTGSNPGNSSIPARDPGAVTGSQFIQDNLNLNGPQREDNILNEFLHGNIPDFLRNFVQVVVTAGSNSITYVVMPDLLAIGSDDDFCRMPMNPHTAQKIANQYDCTLPTVRMANSIWQGATNKVAPKPWGPPYDNTMSDTVRYGVHNKTIQDQMIAAGMDWHHLTAGHKKDVVLTNKLGAPGMESHVAIFGWIQPNGTPIQTLNPSSHADLYEDYSHGLRMIANDCLVNGNPMRMQDVFRHPVYCNLVSDEGILTFTKY